MPHPRKKRKKAFTLVEMAIVLVIIGLIAALIFPALTDFIKFGKKTEAKDFLVQVKDKIIGFALMNKRLPTSLSEIGVGKDPYGNDIFYNRDTDLTSGDLCDKTSTNLDVDRVEQGGATTSYDDIAFVVASFGRNVHQEFVGTETSATVTIYDPRYWPDAPGYTGEYDDYDDMVEYVSLAYLRNKVCTNVANQSFNPPGSDVSFAQNMDDFGQDNVVGTTGSLGQSIQVNAETGTIELKSANGESDYGCLFYSGNLAGVCTNGVCDFGDGFRAYFRFTIDVNSGGGWTFAVVGVNATNGINDGPITTLCGGDGGQYLGYASSGGSLGAVGLEPPKMAVEFDLYCTDASNSYDVQGFGCAVGNDDEHLGIDYWRDDATLNDDVSHEELAAIPADDIRNPSPLLYGGVAPYSGYNTGTMSDGVPKTVRIDVYRNATGIEAGTNNTMEIMAWYDCQNCTDLSLDYNGTNPVADYTAKFWNATDPFPLNNVFSHFRFGWTMGIGGNPQGVELSDFGLAFR